MSENRTHDDGARDGDAREDAAEGLEAEFDELPEAGEFFVPEAEPADGPAPAA